MKILKTSSLTLRTLCFSPLEHLANQRRRITPRIHVSEHHAGQRGQLERLHTVIQRLVSGREEHLQRARRKLLRRSTHHARTEKEGASHTASPSIRGCNRAGSNRVYNWLPNTAADTSNPLPTFPCARQCTNCARLCASVLASVGRSVRSVEEITEKRRRSEVTRDVISAAEDPRPVLWTSASGTPCELNGGIFDRDDMVRGRFMETNYIHPR